ncbi:MAG: hypothetical protein ACKVOL_04210 [Novosphingobium sp.]
MLHKRRVAVALSAAALLLVLAGCMVLPGRFVSDLALRRDGTFSFHYKGEIVLGALADPDMAGLPKGSSQDLMPQKFEPEPCTDPTTDEAHPCSAAEITTQRAKWNDSQREQKTAKASEKEQGRKMMAAMMGGIDPGDPKAAEAFAQRLSRQQGWTSVVSKGRGKFEVEYSISGRLDHDFTFPTIERLPVMLPFVAVIRRSDGTVRVDAPAFTASAANPMIPGLGAMVSKAAESKGQAGPPVLDGAFTVRSDGQILANNTDEGPQPDPASGGSRLDWKVDARTAAAPTALIRIAK